MTEPITAYDQPSGLTWVCQGIMENAASAIGARMDHAQLEDDVQSQIDAFVNDRLVVGPDIVAHPCSHVSQCGNMFQQGDLGVSVATALQPFVRTLLNTQFGDLERTCTVPPDSSGSQKFCHMRIPISRVEALPSGIEFILAEHEHEPIPSVLKLGSELTQNQNDLVARLFEEQCARPATADDDGDFGVYNGAYRRSELAPARLTVDYNYPESLYDISF